MLFYIQENEVLLFFFIKEGEVGWFWYREEV